MLITSVLPRTFRIWRRGRGSRTGDETKFPSVRSCTIRTLAFGHSQTAAAAGQPKKDAARRNYATALRSGHCPDGGRSCTGPSRDPRGSLLKVAVIGNERAMTGIRDQILVHLSRCLLVLFLGCLKPGALSANHRRSTGTICGRATGVHARYSTFSAGGCSNAGTALGTTPECPMGVFPRPPVRRCSSPPRQMKA